MDDNTPLQLFDEIEIHPLIISVEVDTCPDMFPTIYQCLEKLGEPRNYGRRDDSYPPAILYIYHLDFFHDFFTICMSMSLVRFNIVPHIVLLRSFYFCNRGIYKSEKG